MVVLKKWGAPNCLYSAVISSIKGGRGACEREKLVYIMTSIRWRTFGQPLMIYATKINGKGVYKAKWQFCNTTFEGIEL